MALKPKLTRRRTYHRIRTETRSQSEDKALYEAPSQRSSPITSDDVLAIPNSLGGVGRVDGCLNAVEDDNRTDRDDGRRNASGDEDTHGCPRLPGRPQERSYRGPVYGLHSPS